MDAHFNEYLAAVAGMAEVYGAWNDDSDVLACGTQDGAAAEHETAAV